MKRQGCMAERSSEWGQVKDPARPRWESKSSKLVKEKRENDKKKKNGRPAGRGLETRKRKPARRRDEKEGNPPSSKKAQQIERVEKPTRG